MFISVDLPAPFSPRSACTSPRRRSKSMWSLASTPGNCLVIPRSSSTRGSSAIRVILGGGRARPLGTVPLGRRGLDLALRDQLRDRVDLLGDVGAIGLGERLAQLAVADAVVLDGVVLVEAPG